MHICMRFHILSQDTPMHWYLNKLIQFHSMWHFYDVWHVLKKKGHPGAFLCPKHDCDSFLCFSMRKQTFASFSQLLMSYFAACYIILTQKVYKILTPTKKLFMTLLSAARGSMKLACLGILKLHKKLCFMWRQSRKEGGSVERLRTTLIWLLYY